MKRDGRRVGTSSAGVDVPDVACNANFGFGAEIS
jgi:hypothetical protein